MTTLGQQPLQYVTIAALQRNPHARRDSVGHENFSFCSYILFFLFSCEIATPRCCTLFTSSNDRQPSASDRHPCDYLSQHSHRKHRMAGRSDTLPPLCPPHPCSNKNPFPAPFSLFFRQPCGRRPAGSPAQHTTVPLSSCVSTPSSYQLGPIAPPLPKSRVRHTKSVRFYCTHVQLSRGPSCT